MPFFIDVFHGFYRTAIVPTFIDIVPFLINIVPIYNLFLMKTRSSWLNCALRDDEAVYWVNIGHFEAAAVGN